MNERVGETVGNVSRKGFREQKMRSNKRTVNKLTIKGVHKTNSYAVLMLTSPVEWHSSASRVPSATIKRSIESDIVDR